MGAKSGWMSMDASFSLNVRSVVFVLHHQHCGYAKSCIFFLVLSRPMPKLSFVLYDVFYDDVVADD